MIEWITDNIIMQDYIYIIISYFLSEIMFLQSTLLSSFIGNAM